ncbi:protein TRIGALACTOSYLDIACYLGLYCEROL 1, chloroplastic isoform X2 [Fagus crenata]
MHACTCFQLDVYQVLIHVLNNLQKNPDGWMKMQGSYQLRFAVRPWTYKYPMPVLPTRLCAISNKDDGCPSVPVLEEDTNHAPSPEARTLLSKWSPPRTIKGKVHWRNTLQQLERVGPRSVGVCLLTSAFVGMAFTIQFVREFTRLGLNRSVGGVLALAFSRELSPVVTSIVVAGRIGSAFAAELGTMQVSEQTDTLRVLGADPVDYLVTPRVIASCIAVPFLTLMCFMVGMASSALLADSVYGVSINIILDSAQRALRRWDTISAMIKSQVFGAIISILTLRSLTASSKELEIHLRIAYERLGESAGEVRGGGGSGGFF